ncbi:MAG: cyclic pyranopterin monophosphate synthase MoaC [Desulfovibrionaceae bacterium]|jgi:cyclic pyranopterin phosphate synthase|nr:cyclic pyranopterin monophosphate synthase MoaC [Desulfovibrionaceae bacterium]
MDEKLTHITDEGRPRMVDVGAKADTQRRAVARCTVRLAPRTFGLLTRGELPKGDAFTVAQVAGIQAAKRTHELIPLCHPLFLRFVDVTFAADAAGHAIHVTGEARTEGKTGVEMEALVAAQVAALAIYDMCKAVQKDIVITDCRLVHKSGGKSGTFEAE